MKKAMILALSVLIVLALGSCKQLLDGSSGAKPGEGTVKFQFSPPGEDGIQPLHNIDDAHAVLVSIEDEEGNAVYTDESLLLYAFGGGYVSESLALGPGGYSLTAFLVVDDGGTAIFAAPVSGSARAYLVDTPLPLSFAVSRDAVATVAPEILDTEESEPEEFGYTSFEFTVVETFEFLLSVFEVSGAGSELTGAHLLVRAGSGQTLFDGPVAAETNVIEVQDGYDTYTVRVVKDGYDPWETVFTRNDLAAYAGDPLTVTFGATPSWIEQEKLLAVDAGSDHWFGEAVALGGQYAAVNAWGDDANGLDSGSVYVFERNGTTWVEHAKLLPDDGAARQFFGSSVSISGNRLIVGASGDDEVHDGAGAAYVFEREGDSWYQRAKLLPSDGLSKSFGCSVSLVGDYAAIGARYDGSIAPLAGSVYMFYWDGDSWVKQAKLGASDGVANAVFGWSVSTDGEITVVGARGDDDKGSDAGSTYIFERNGTSWSERAKLVASDGAPGDNFGTSVSLYGTYVLVGAFRDDVNGDSSGSAYVFSYDGTAWTQEQKLIPTDGATNDQFGFTVSLAREFAVIGAMRDDDNGNGSGSAYVFGRTATSWTQTQKLLPADGAPDDAFGWSIGAGGERVLIGARYDDDVALKAGSAYVFSLAE